MTRNTKQISTIHDGLREIEGKEEETLKKGNKEKYLKANDKYQSFFKKVSN